MQICRRSFVYNPIIATPAQAQMFQHTDVSSLNGGLGGLETQTNIFVPSPATLANLLALRLDLRVDKDVRLLLISTLRLDSQLGRHGCCVCKSNTNGLVG